MLNEITDYHSLPNFTCLSGEEEAMVIMSYQKMMGILDESADAVMGDAETDADLGPPAQSVDDDAEVISDDEDAAEYSARSGRDQLLDALGNLYELSETLTVCIYCGSTEHDHLQCENPSNKEIKKVLKNMRAVLTDKDDDDEMEQEEEEKTEKDEDAPEEEVSKEQRQQQEQSRMGEYHWYEYALPMPEVGDLDEGGAFNIEGRKIDLEGPNERKELMNIVDEAVRQGGGDTWSVREFMNNYPDTNIRKKMYKRVSAPKDGFLKVIPITGCMFHNYPWFQGVEYDINYSFPNNSRLYGDMKKKSVENSTKFCDIMSAKELDIQMVSAAMTQVGWTLTTFFDTRTSGDNGREEIMSISLQRGETMTRSIGTKKKQETDLHCSSRSCSQAPGGVDEFESKFLHLG